MENGGITQHVKKGFTYQMKIEGESSNIKLWSLNTWVWVNTYRYIFSGMNIHLPAILGFTRYQGFDPSPHEENDH
jgi:hypothetical protein